MSKFVKYMIMSTLASSCVAHANPNGKANQAEPTNLEAIWEGLEKQAKPESGIKISREELKLARERAAWRAKWEAEQKAKQLAGNNSSSPANNQTNQVLDGASSNTQQAPGINQKVLRQAMRQLNRDQPQQLTRAQYHERWKQQQAASQTTQTASLSGDRVTPPATYNTAARSPYRASNDRAAHVSLPEDIKQKLRSARLNESAISTYVQDVNSPKPLLAYKEQAARVPASVMKLITSYAALGILGPNYRWPVDVYTKGSIENGTLNGDLVIKGFGSPDFNNEELSKVLRGVRQKGIRNIAGRVVFDNSHFSIPNHEAGSFDGQKYKAYNALPDALLFNERINSFQVSTAGKKVRVSTTTPAHNLVIVNRMRKVNRGCRPRIGISRRGAQNIVTFSGKYSSRCGTRTYTRVISKPSEMLYGAIKSMWKREVGGSFNAKFAEGTIPSNSSPILRTYSRTLAEILPTIDKESNNVMARQVLLTLGAKHFGGQGTPRKGANAVSAWLSSRGLNFPELRIENGSGLSRHARITARHLGDLLVDAYKSPHRNILMKSLAIAGVDGTMKGRLRQTPVQGKGFFKTGTLRDVRSIAGYVKAANGRTYAVAILHNDPKARRRGLPVHDELIKWVFYAGTSNNRLALR